MKFKSNRQRKAVMAKLKAFTTKPYSDVITGRYEKSVKIPKGSVIYKQRDRSLDIVKFDKKKDKITYKKNITIPRWITDIKLKYDKK